MRKNQNELAVLVKPFTLKKDPVSRKLNGSVWLVGTFLSLIKLLSEADQGGKNFFGSMTKIWSTWLETEIETVFLELKKQNDFYTFIAYNAMPMVLLKSWTPLHNLFV